MEVISTRRYEARPPPVVASSSGTIVDPEDSVALVKEEEWETRKKKEITTTRQIETRVKRQVVLEDGEVVVDSGPLVTTNTTEDVERQERTTQERRATGDPQEVESPVKAIADSGNLLQQELNETIVRSREEIEERLETEDHRQLGDISDEAYLRAVTSNRGDLRLALAESTKKISRQTGPRVVKHTTKSNKVVDTENTSEKRESKADGSIVTERKTTVEREEIKDDEVPDDGTGADVVDSCGNDEAFETKKESSRRYAKKRDEEIVDYVSGGEKIGRETLYVAETIEGERVGDRSPSPTDMRTTRFQERGVSSPMRLGRFSTNLEETREEQEDEARKFETSKWLESHFGSESRSSRGSLDADDPSVPSANTGYINVTMRSRTPRDYDDSRVRRREEHTWYHEKEKQSNISRTSSPSLYYAENGHPERARNHQVESTFSKSYESERRREQREIHDTPSPPTRRSTKEKRAVVSEEKEIRDTRGQERETFPGNSPRKSSSRSRSASPKTPSPVTSREQNKNEKNRARSKYKIGESFRKLVGKLRSASGERKNKRSISQPTQTDDDGPTYLRYNTIDRHVPVLAEDKVDGEEVEEPPRRPPRSPKHKTSRTIEPQGTNDRRNEERRRRDSPPPVHRYYLGEDPFGRESYGETERVGSRGRVERETDYSLATGSLGRFKDTRRYERRQDGTLPRTSHSTEEKSYYRRTHSMPRRTQERRRTQSPGYDSTIVESLSLNNSTVDSSSRFEDISTLKNGTINVSIKSKNSVRNAASPENSHVIPVRYDFDTPVRSTPKPSLSRSRSLNVETDKVNGHSPRFNVSYLTSTPKNRLDETPPLKSPGILASIGRSNRNFLENNEYEH